MTFGESKFANYKISNIRYKVDYSFFDINYKNIERKIKKKLKIFNLKFLGKHNVFNATAAIAICLNLGVNQNIIKKLKKIFRRSKKNDKNFFQR